MDDPPWKSIYAAQAVALRINSQQDRLGDGGSHLTIAAWTEGGGSERHRWSHQPVVLSSAVG
eukprot:3444315-Pyramimonas_sp.AAC.1